MSAFVLDKYLDDLEARIDPADEDRLEQDWRRFADGQWPDDHFVPARTPRPSTIEWPAVNMDDALDDVDLMIYQQLRTCHGNLASGYGEMLCVRANYGVGIIPTMIGCALYRMPREQDMLPAAKPLEGGADALEERIGQPVDHSAGLAGSVFAFANRLQEVLAPYPHLRRYLHAYNPDLQGPLSLLEATWGADLYLHIYAKAEFVDRALAWFAEVVTEFVEKWQERFPAFDADHSVEWGMLHPGRVIIRNDAAMNVSGRVYKKMVAQHDESILKALGGGVHFCGRGDHFIGHVAQLEGLSCVNMSQPELNDMDKIYAATVDEGISILGMPEPEVRRAIEAGRPLRGRVHCGASLAAWLPRDL